MNELNDPEKYIITGLENLVFPNNVGSSYFFKTSLYKSFCELDFVEMRRLSSQSSKNQHNLDIVKKFDRQAFFASYDGYSMLSALTGDLYFFKHIE